MKILTLICHRRYSISKVVREVLSPLQSSIVNEQGRIWLRYLKHWDYISVHLYDASVSSPKLVTHTYCSDAHTSLSTIDHILTPKHLPSHFSNSRVEEEDPLNLSDHQPLLSNFKCNLQLLLQDSAAKQGSDASDKQPKPNWGN